MVNVLTTNLLRVKWKVVDSDRHLKTFFFLSMNLKIGPKFRILKLGQVDLCILVDNKISDANKEFV